MPILALGTEPRMELLLGRLKSPWPKPIKASLQAMLEGLESALILVREEA
jgi:hypothetical protein